jgi:hypothetical protein
MCTKNQMTVSTVFTVTSSNKMPCQFSVFRSVFVSVISMINSSVGIELISVLLKANRLRLVSVVGVPLTCNFWGYNSYSLARSRIFSSLYGTITEIFRLQKVIKRPQLDSQKAWLTCVALFIFCFVVFGIKWGFETIKSSSGSSTNSSKPA